MDYFKKEPPSADKVKLIRFLAEYDTDSTLKAMDIMMRNKAESLNGRWHKKIFKKGLTVTCHITELPET